MAPGYSIRSLRGMLPIYLISARASINTSVCFGLTPSLKFNLKTQLRSTLAFAGNEACIYPLQVWNSG